MKSFGNTCNTLALPCLIKGMSIDFWILSIYLLIELKRLFYLNILAAEEQPHNALFFLYHIEQ